MATQTLWNAPFQSPLRISSLELPEDAKRILLQMGMDIGETIEKLHSAPLGEPVSILIGSQQFALRKDLCQKIIVEKI